MKPDNKIQELTDEINGCDIVIQDNPNDHATYSTKGMLLLELSKYTNDKGHYTQAIECYDKAIELFPYTPLYLAERAKLYFEINQTESAIDDIRKIKQLPNAVKTIEKMYIQNIIKKIENSLGYSILPIEIEYYNEPLIEISYAVDDINLNGSTNIKNSNIES
ncbi:MAG TPA: hypothetical protein LFW20_02245 [Rickettsia endosymbiont of Omalisus fontisbellaquei]|nr:hypothetical protein [Rickettsia endosymbiont of Omalisus fontisbellaquei]